MCLASSTTSAGASGPSWVLVVAAVLVSGLLLAGPALRRHYPVAWWLLLGFPVAAFRVMQTWRPLMAGCGLAVSRRPALTVVSGLVGNGAPPPQPRVPRRGLIRPTSGGFVLLVRLLPGQVPEDVVKAAPAMAESWQVHAVRVTSWKPGVVRIVASASDPLAALRTPKQRGPGHLLRVAVGVLETGAAWVVDLRGVPHWLIVGATRSGKSTLINALVAGLAPQHIALVGIDCKGGMELSLYEPRLSALATNREQAVRLLAALVNLTLDRMSVCRAARVRNVWGLPEKARPVPVVVIVDEIAELFLVASRSEKDEAQAAGTALIRLAQLGAALGVFLVVAGQRVGSDLGPGVTALRAQLGGRVCHRVADPGTAEMALGDLNPDALKAAQAITPEQAGTAVLASGDGWERARSHLITEAEAEAVATEYAHLTPVLSELHVEAP
ncbi:FtsK/SpoIIIE domain-containing protein [Streptomyces sp. VMFN-G11Ma]|jgi:S-DNA-T family DNA segregation ATPase FtsK/SpoIIIE|uniref:FtsK/SpoIIIE domain-containing protein n=1 Tax=Streptomyces sp. VMFN-G11Ma TaxID=2135609 RepID=UPI000D39F60C|nr:FtsK/SpoIIIE domain-containing protein [Streptomyces sp. VMFN-G11Ma]PTM87655.1 S-DNA-T family DNA segregation ATPase FtsK/SpoIIIE [Streptomyces sp. VMFN-G11Ma]